MTNVSLLIWDDKQGTPESVSAAAGINSGAHPCSALSVLQNCSSSSIGGMLCDHQTQPLCSCCGAVVPHCKQTLGHEIVKEFPALIFALQMLGMLFFSLIGSIS